ncbi:hypothetical protein BM536_034665 [Streptomyces phaeoluteigriseus]|uniref:Uncharacterized protein n=1 Tax=Streptomyces phaeoluteigriseus TaxID=114686 RepID=A0A1V6MII5_9ACTN|nr:hypothetical protein BM536_034665 [Streptomyces phaeoluteigriseus]
MLSSAVSGAWCVQPRGGGGSRRGASASDDNAADARAGPRVCGVIRTTGPRPQLARAPGHLPFSSRVAGMSSPVGPAVRARPPLDSVHGGDEARDRAQVRVR